MSAGSAASSPGPASAPGPEALDRLRAAWTGSARAAELIAKQGSFEGFGSFLPFHRLDAFLRQPR